MEIQCKFQIKYVLLDKNGLYLPSNSRQLKSNYFCLKGKILLPNAAGGVLISNQSLVLQHVHKEMSGVYTCMAHNIEGDGTSNPMTLNIRCKYEKSIKYQISWLMNPRI